MKEVKRGVLVVKEETAQCGGLPAGPLTVEAWEPGARDSAPEMLMLSAVLRGRHCFPFFTHEEAKTQELTVCHTDGSRTETLILVIQLQRLCSFRDKTTVFYSPTFSQPGQRTGHLNQVLWPLGTLPLQTSGIRILSQVPKTVFTLYEITCRTLAVLSLPSVPEWDKTSVWCVCSFLKAFGKSELTKAWTSNLPPFPPGCNNSGRWLI